jgi:hypothetical protein
VPEPELPPLPEDVPDPELPPPVEGVLGGAALLEPSVFAAGFVSVESDGFDLLE